MDISQYVRGMPITWAAQKPAESMASRKRRVCKLAAGGSTDNDTLIAYGVTEKPPYIYAVLWVIVDGMDLIARGRARCGKHDEYSYEFGKRVATGRAVADIARQMEIPQGETDKLRRSSQRIAREIDTACGTSPAGTFENRVVAAMRAAERGVRWTQWY